MISAVIGMSLGKIGHPCNLQFVYALFRPIIYIYITRLFLVSKLVFAFTELNMRFSVNVLLFVFCIVTPGPAV